jgi:hypothetical protein
MRSGGAVTPIGIVLLLAGSAFLAASREGDPASAEDVACHSPRWPVKTLSDSRAHLVDFHPRHTRVNHLRHKPRPRVRRHSPRLRGVERKTFSVRSRLIEFALAEDHDIHLVISSHRRARTMIVEFPNVRCNGARDSIKKRAMRRARNQLTAACGFPSSSFTPLDGKARITGVGFFDLLHGQRGVAPNGIELHPVLRFDHADC